MIRLVGSALVLLVTTSCHRAAVERATPDDEHWSRVIVHTTLDPPVALRVSPGIAVLQGMANAAGPLPLPAYERVDAFPVERRCRRQSMCLLAVRNRLGAVVFAREVVDAVIDEHPQPDVGGRLLWLRLYDLGDDGDPRVREEIEQRLASPRFAGTVAARIAEALDRTPDAVALQPGDTLPKLEFRSVEGEPIRTDDGGERPLLVYFSASWCGGCIEALPRLRRLSDAHPELRIVYVLFDGPHDAREFRTRRAPVPGELAWTTEDDQKALRPDVLAYPRLPSFVLADGTGTVVATSDETELAALDELLRAPP